MVAYKRTTVNDSIIQVTTHVQGQTIFRKKNSMWIIL